MEEVKKVIEAPKEENMVEKANAAAERLEKANKEMEALVTRQEVAAANARLGGKSALTNVQAPVEETPKEYAKKVMKGEYNRK